MSNTSHNYTGQYAFVSLSSGTYMSAVQTDPGIFENFATLQLNSVIDYWTITTSEQYSGGY